MNDKLKKALHTQLGKKYLNQKELQYSTEANVLLTPYEYKKYLEYKEDLIERNEEKGLLIGLPLKSFNSRFIYYCLGDELLSLLESYSMLLKEDYAYNSDTLSNRFASNIYKSRLYSEIEGSLNVENVPTTRRRLKELLEENAKAENVNDIIIQNMDKAIKFVEGLPSFNKENLLKLYNILSDNCLEEDNKLREGDYYRYDTVEIGGYHGCPYSQISECMDSLFKFVNDSLKQERSLTWMLMPYICHYYILYIHPYFDYNGRTARMVSYWILLLANDECFPPIISEAINQTKSQYYRALEQSRDSHNDMSYFFIYLFSISCDYILCYKNVESIEQQLKNKGILLTDTDRNYIKKIMITYNGKFTYMDFLKNCNIEMSKQGALKTLNKLVGYGFLEITETPSKSKLFDVNKAAIPYKLSSFNL